MRRQTGVDGDPTDFTFSVYGRGGSGDNDTPPGSYTQGQVGSDFKLSDNEVSTLSLVGHDLQDRWYLIVENSGSYSVTGRSCTDGPANGWETTGSSSIYIDMGTTGNQLWGDCTFTNTAPPPASGTITVHKGSTRSAGVGTGLNYSTGLQDAVFEYSSDGNTWTDLCTTDAGGKYTCPVVQPGTYTVREKSAPAPYSIIPRWSTAGTRPGRQPDARLRRAPSPSGTPAPSNRRS